MCKSGMLSGMIPGKYVIVSVKCTESAWKVCYSVGRLPLNVES